MELRAPTAADTERIAELVESSMTASYQLSPQQIEDIVDSEFGEGAVTAKADGDAAVVRVAETGEDLETETVVAYVEGALDGDRGELTWLFVDPEHRGKGIGTELFESTREALREAGASEVAATSLKANTEGHQFFERFGLEHVDNHEVEVADQSLVQYVYADSSAGAAAEQSGADGELPGTETRDGATTATTEGGERVYVARDERESGTEAPFFVTYVDEEHAERFGYYCANCGSLDVSMDDTDRLECPDCANSHAQRSGDSYDDSYL